MAWQATSTNCSTAAGSQPADGNRRQTRVLLLDEHTAGLDPKTGEFVMRLPRGIVAELKLTAVMVTHTMAQASQYGDRMVMFHRGEIIFDRFCSAGGAASVWSADGTADFPAVILRENPSQQHARTGSRTYDSLRMWI